MVNVKENIGHYIKNPTEIQKEDLESIQQLSERYPFCSTLSILLLEGFHQFDFVAYEKFLSQAAILAPDRARLHSILEYQNDPSVLDEEEVSIEKEVPKDEVESVLEQDVAETTPEVEETVDEKPEALENTADSSESVTASEPETEDKPGLRDEILEESSEGEESSENKKDKEYDNFEKELIASAINSSILSEVDDEDAIQYKPFSNKKEDQKSDEADSNSQEKENEAQPESFIQFLRKVSNKESQSKGDVEKKLEEKKSQTSDAKPTSSSKKDIVDAFIHNPEQQKSKKSFFSPTENAKKSLEENIDNVSETLAKIHELQGNYGKAIQSYEKLILKFPEKKSFFANRIEELKKK